MGRPWKKSEEFHDLFLEELHSNEDCMGEMAAFAVTCEMFEIDEQDGWELLIKYSEILEPQEDNNDG